MSNSFLQMNPEWNCQLAIVVVITVGLIGVMTKLMNTVRENISKANDNANTEMQGILRDANSDS